MLSRGCLTNGELAGSIPVWLNNNPGRVPFLQGTDVGNSDRKAQHRSSHKKNSLVTSNHEGLWVPRSVAACASAWMSN